MPRPATLAAAAALVLSVGALVWVATRPAPSTAADTPAAQPDEENPEVAATRHAITERDARIAELEARLETEPGTATPPTGAAPPPPVAPGTLRKFEQLAEEDSTPEREATLARYAAATRAQAEGMIATAQETAEAAVLAEIAAERTSMAVLRAEGAMAWLAALQRGYVAPWRLLLDAQRYGKIFERQIEASSVDGPTLRADTALVAGNAIVYPAGTHAVDVDVLAQRTPFPTDVLIVGQGMNETLLHFDDVMRMRGQVQRLTFRDLTIDTGDSYLEAMRNGPYTLRLERCRIIGFDMGAGGSSMLSGSVGAFYASGCRIEAGFGRSPGFGNLFDVRGALVARLEDCTLVGPFRSIWRRSSRAAHVFERCRLEQMGAGMRARVEQSSPECVRFVDCTFDDLPPKQRASSTRRSWSEINPAWKK